MPPEVEFVAKAIAQIREQYNIDPQRVVVHGQQAGGSLAYMVAFLHRDVVRGVAAVDAPFSGRRSRERSRHAADDLYHDGEKSQLRRADHAKGIEQFRKLKYAVTVVDQGDNGPQSGRRTNSPSYCGGSIRWTSFEADMHRPTVGILALMLLAWGPHCLAGD